MDLTLRMGLHIACFHRPEMVGIPDLNYIQCQPALLNTKKQIKLLLLNKIKADLTYQFATLISPPTVSWFASANHDSQRKLILDLTVCILSTWPHMQAWVEAFSVKASMFGWAITISNAPWLFYYRFGN